MTGTEAHEQRLQYFRAIFDGFPSPAFVLDQEIRIHDFNSAAEPFLGADPAAGLLRKSGEALHCIHAIGHGCGNSEACRDCVIRNSVRAVFGGGTVNRQWHEAFLRRGPITSRIELLVSANILPYTDPPKVLLVLESFSDLATKMPLLNHRHKL
jgi:PAS domain-containing protein